MDSQKPTMKTLIIFLVLFHNSYATFYDSFSGKPITEEEQKRHVESNTASWCTNEVAPCDPEEGRRIDGSCNNLDNPSIGMVNTRFARVLPPVFDKVTEPRKAASGNELPPARYLRTRFLAEGYVPSKSYTQLIVHFLLFMVSDVTTQHDTRNYILFTPYCCAPEGKTDPVCISNTIPDNDPVHRFSGERCLNLTRPDSYQARGCLSKGTTPERIVAATPLTDLSLLYGASENLLIEKFRTFQGGMLKYEVENGLIWPPSNRSEVNDCLLNDNKSETRCHSTPNDSSNSLAGINFFTIWFWRLHNHIASELAKVNPCWDDQKLFDNAREINIATALQILYYEAMPQLLGKENLEKDKVISTSSGFRDIYDSNVLPQTSLEYPYAYRWMHTMQEGSVNMYDTEGAYLKQIPVANLTTRTGYLALDDNFIGITQGSLRQGAAAADYTVDPDMSEVGMGALQKVLDIPTNDLTKTRYFGFQPYIKYREFCFGKPIKHWHDLNGIIDPERIETLKTTYTNIEDIDLMAGIWLEKHIHGGGVPSTFYCLLVDQLLRNAVSDRHWYERPNRPNAFTLPQLLEIRKRTIAGMMCDVGDSVSKIQPAAFLRIGPNNEMVDCDQIARCDYSAWKDETCNQPIERNTY